ncbi:unnamed protein product [Heligmosomoides polygyrus]|uniref:Uncharacterized protein n=1 Tax=Heligmosomoides polygyrus TaxID=6339 RepID=A0A3P7XP25_HELPZ|nr:unnamed protein product [Heligmosomoides polygyrus]
MEEARENSDLPALMDFRAAVEASMLKRRLQNAFRSALLYAASDPNALPFRPYSRAVAPSAADYESSNLNDLMA